MVRPVHRADQDQIAPRHCGRHLWTRLAVWEPMQQQLTGLAAQVSAQMAGEMFGAGQRHQHRIHHAS